MRFVAAIGVRYFCRDACVTLLFTVELDRPSGFEMVDEFWAERLRRLLPLADANGPMGRRLPVVVFVVAVELALSPVMYPCFVVNISIFVWVWHLHRGDAFYWVMMACLCAQEMFRK